MATLTKRGLFCFWYGSANCCAILELIKESAAPESTMAASLCVSTGSGAYISACNGGRACAWNRDATLSSGKGITDVKENAEHGSGTTKCVHIVQGGKATDENCAYILPAHVLWYTYIGRLGRLPLSTVMMGAGFHIFGVCACTQNARGWEQRWRRRGCCPSQAWPRW